MSNRLNRSNLQVSEVLVKFIENEALPNTGVNSEVFWSKLEAILDKFVPQNKLLLQKRTSFKNKIDNFYKTNKGKKIIPNDYINFLKEINYIVPEGIDFQINTQNVDPELSLNAGPQLVVPVMNARYALNAANARWGSMYDALYGTDVITEENGAEKGKSYNPIRGQHVVNYCREFLDKYFPLEKGSHKDTVSYVINDNSLQVTLSNDEKTKLKDDSKFVGYQGQLDNPLCILLKNNNLHV